MGNGERDEALLRHGARFCFPLQKNEQLNSKTCAAACPQPACSPFPVPRSRRAQCAPRLPHAQRAFTLMEMLAVIILIGIAAAAVSISVAHGLASARINAAAGELAAALRGTRTQAIVHGQPRFFQINTRDETYRGPDQRDVRLPKGLELSVTSATSDQSHGDIARIRFFPDGSSTGGRITIRSGKREWHVNVSWLTGAISMFDTAEHSS
jgi:general secretion pathway protein H